MTSPQPSYLRQGWFLTLLLCVAIAQLPLLSLGYGADADAWRVAHSADMLWRTGMYEPSRLPGYPLHEFITAPLIALGGAIASNTATLIASLFLILVWSKLVAREARHPRLLVITLACTPLLWINYSVTMDYVWSLLFLLLSFDAALRRSVIPAGLLLGIAVGFRPSNVVVGAAFILLLHLRERSFRRVAYFVAAAASAAIVAFLPLLIKYGPIGWFLETQTETQDVHLPLDLRLMFFVYRGLYAAGPLAFIIALLAFYHSRRDLKNSVVARDGFIATCFGVIAVVVVLFAVFPLERMYLLPAFPFLYLLLDRFTSGKMFTAFAAGIISFGIINPDIVRHKIPIGEPGVNVHRGMVMEDWQRRAYVMKERVRIPGIMLSDSSMLITGMGPSLFTLNDALEPDTGTVWKSVSRPVHRQRSGSRMRLIEFLGPEELRFVLDRGFDVYCLESAKPTLERSGVLHLEGTTVRVIP